MYGKWVMGSALAVLLSACGSDAVNSTPAVNEPAPQQQSTTPEEKPPQGQQVAMTYLLKIDGMT